MRLHSSAESVCRTGYLESTTMSLAAVLNQHARTVHLESTTMSWAEACKDCASGKSMS